MQSDLTDITRANMRIDTLSLQLREAGQRATALREDNDDLQARVATLEAKLAQREAEVGRMEESTKLAHYYLGSYSSDAEMATHAKRVLANMIHALTPTANEEKNDA